MKKIVIRSAMFVLIALYSTHCGSDKPKTSLIDPSKNPDLLGKALVIDNATNKAGTAPLPTTATGTPNITNAQSSASVTSNSKIFIPFSFTSASPVTGIYLLVVNSGTYWDIKITAGVSNGQIVLPVGIPANVLKGNFQIAYCLYNSNNQVSQPRLLDSEIVDLISDCSTGNLSESGSDGLTVRSYTFSKGGTLNLSYNMYSAPDRMDVFLDGTWIAGTGASISSNQAPPASNCSTPAAGFVSGTGTKSITYKSGQRLDVYISGCFGGTAWDYSLTCP
jgi:hypothetical protein